MDDYALVRSGGSHGGPVKRPPDQTAAASLVRETSPPRLLLGPGRVAAVGVACTWQPARARAAPIARPSPAEPPVTSATCPSRGG